MPISFKPKPITQQEAERVLPERVQIWIDEFDKAGLQYGLSSKDEEEIVFDHRVRQRPDTLDVVVYKVVRVKNPETQEEFMYYGCQKSVLDKNDNRIKYNNLYGIHPLPHVETRRDENDMKTAGDFSHFGIVYEIKWNEQEFDRLCKAAKNQIRNLIVAQTSEVWNQRYSGTAYHIKNKENFRNLSWEELVQMGEEGEELPRAKNQKVKTRTDKGKKRPHPNQYTNINRQANRQANRPRPSETKAAEITPEPTTA
ncbi:MAG TPA: hypothetical protein VGE97_03460 [Nitrososphaera sp.]